MVLGDLFDFYLIIRLSLCLFNYSGNIDVYNGNISNFLSIYLMFLLPLLLLLLHHHWQKFQLDAHSWVFGRRKLYVWSFAKINFNECHIHWIVHCTFGIDWKHYNFIAFIFKPSERIGKKTKQDFRLPLLFFLLFVIAILLKSWSARIARSWSSRVKVDPK